MNDDAPDADATAEVDAVFGVLSDVHRRYALYYLRDRESATVDELATILAGWLGTREDAGKVVTPEDRERERTALHHVHLPKLAEAEYVRYDPETDDVTLELLPELAETVLDRSLDQQRDAADRSDRSVSDHRAG
ncbi:DUF7344 domain-containing protein [Halorussus caseinilyticus]|uniref:ArsR family transcriptional regulator n=1 Tax=Halorussus caseinilyticus TaxID=3034025 RepID=A0ABD5WQ11_9EURY|nr:hypothetical protein [Halorussus sp. DT72]